MAVNNTKAAGICTIFYDPHFVQSTVLTDNGTIQIMIALKWFSDSINSLPYPVKNLTIYNRPFELSMVESLLIKQLHKELMVIPEYSETVERLTEENNPRIFSKLNTLLHNTKDAVDIEQIIDNVFRYIWNMYSDESAITYARRCYHPNWIIESNGSRITLIMHMFDHGSEHSQWYRYNGQYITFGELEQLIGKQLYRKIKTEYPDIWKELQDICEKYMFAELSEVTTTQILQDLYSTTAKLPASMLEEVPEF